MGGCGGLMRGGAWAGDYVCVCVCEDVPVLETFHRNSSA